MTHELLILTLSAFGAIASLTWWISRWMLDTQDERLRQRLRAGDLGLRAAEDSKFSPLSLLQNLGQAAAGPFMPKSSQAASAMRRRLAQAGIYSPSAIRTVCGCKVIFLAAGLLGGYALGASFNQLLLGLSIGALLGYLLPGMWIQRQIRLQQKAMERGLPDALDLLVVCVEAGLTIDAAFQRVSQELVIAHPRLARELELTHMETRMGLSRSQAMRNLGQRTGFAPLQMLATMLIQAERFGTSIAQSLRIHAETLRIARQHAAEEMAAKASVKLSFPVVLFIFPALLIVLVGPAAIGLLKMFSE